MAVNLSPRILNLGLVTRGKKTVFKIARLIPSVKRKLDTEMEKVSAGFIRDVEERTSHLQYITSLPKDGLNNDKIMEILNDNLNLGQLEKYMVISDMVLT